MMTFDSIFESLTGKAPFPWQRALYERFVGKRTGGIPSACVLPTGLGKTSVVAIWLISLAELPDQIPRRLVYVVNRRTVVDQTTDEVELYRERLRSESLRGFREALTRIWSRPLGQEAETNPLAISTLRGQFADNGDWCEDPSRPAVICGTVDMIGSRLLFSGYGIGRAKRPLHAGFLGQDTLLIHDEAHLEPAFQRLIETIQTQQRDNEPDVSWPKLKVIELTATSKSTDPFKLDDKDYENRIVDQRMNAVKQLRLHELKDAKKPAKELAERAMAFKDSGRAILLFAQSVETVLDIQSALEKAKIAAVNIRTLTGTMRGKERDDLVRDKTFGRFLPEPPGDCSEGTVYLICTSAGEVGVNISADHLICDLTTYESMAQRFGRVNRFGKFAECEVHVFYPGKSAWDEKHPLTPARQQTLELLDELKHTGGSVSPRALSTLDEVQRAAAFAPHPTILPVTDMLFDAWALTTIIGRLPGRPATEAYLHGLTENELPETHVAWRLDVQLLEREEIDDSVRVELLLAYPLLPKELLREPSYRAVKHLDSLGKRHPDHRAWLVDNDGTVEQITLDWFTDKDNRELINNKTVVLDPRSGGLSAGLLDGASESADDVSITDDRCRSADLVPADFHEVFSLEIAAGDEDQDTHLLRWFVRKNTGEVRSKKPVLLNGHVADVQTRMDDILSRLSLGNSLSKCLKIAAGYHDEGKRRLIFQAMLGNRTAPTVWWAKSGRKTGTRIEEKYRHEFGSLNDLPSATYLGITEDERELVLHLIAAHHGRARPHFPPDEVFDPNQSDSASGKLASTVPQRFGRLQRKFGRWGLAYLESLLRAADWSASANPNPEGEVDE
ncbi:MAG: type I-U CRISPR-associated helicase/endonuclease Cas3 [Planctomycetaceae bacterium]|nr:type I-U CRISPR-associated helicase/endonuclease Cas3 [Planctomycetaceae bacterium]